VTPAPGKHILLVEQEGSRRDELAALLSKLKYGVAVVAAVDDALAHLRSSNRTDVVLVDLPAEEAQRLRRAQQEEPALATVPLLAVGEPGDCDADAHVPRPVDGFVLNERLNQLLARAALAPGGPRSRGLNAFLTEQLATIATRLPELAAKLRALNPDMRSIDQLMHQTLRDGAEVQSYLSYLRAFGTGKSGVRAPIDVRQTLDFVIRVGMPHISRRASVYQTFAEVPLVMGAEEDLAQVFSCIIINAAQAIPFGDPQGNRIDVMTFPDDKGWAVVQISDTGLGIPKELHARIFEPFYSTKRGLGLGLGLFVVRNTVALYGGRLSVQSEVGSGATFQIALPPARLGVG
jgi:signal transduction histidine kinase